MLLEKVQRRATKMVKGQEIAIRDQAEEVEYLFPGKTKTARRLDRNV